MTLLILFVPKKRKLAYDSDTIALLLHPADLPNCKLHSLSRMPSIRVLIVILSLMVKAMLRLEQKGE
jgi:hypothetical protein